MTVIPFFLVQNPGGGREEALARRMGMPPWSVQTVDGDLPVSQFCEGQDAAVVGMIFDPVVWYSHECWRRWLQALEADGLEDRINVPLGNQDPSWSGKFRVAPYFTLRGLELASRFADPVRWIMAKPGNPWAFCVAVVPVSHLRLLSASLRLSDLPRYWTEIGQEVRVFCEGWLHSFNALEEAGRREDLLSMCPWEGEILELGCGSGLMARACRERGFQVRWIGVDVSHEKLARARSFVDLCVRGDLNHPLPFAEEMKFDRIACGDVLEHLPYPWDLMGRLRSRLKPDGLLVASFPNVGHWSTVEDLLSGRWDETPSGLFCVTHLRFGTKRSWERWLAQSGFRIIRWETEKIPLPEKWILPPGAVDANYDRESLETVRYRVLAGLNP